MHDMSIIQDASGGLTGNGGYPAGSGPTYAYPYNWTLIGQVTGTHADMTITYQNGYVANLGGTISAGWDYITGTSSDAGVTEWFADRVP